MYNKSSPDKKCDKTHYCAEKKEEECRELIHPLLPRDSEVLQSLTRLCFNVPHRYHSYIT